jgi:hypothetical protein
LSHCPRKLELRCHLCLRGARRPAITPKAYRSLPCHSSPLSERKHGGFRTGNIDDADAMGLFAKGTLPRGPLHLLVDGAPDGGFPCDDGITSGGPLDQIRPRMSIWSDNGSKFWGCARNNSTRLCTLGMDNASRDVNHLRGYVY